MASQRRDAENGAASEEEEGAIFEKPSINEEISKYLQQKKTSTGTVGPYIPPSKLAELNKGIVENGDTASDAYQRIAWDALKKSIHGLINKANISNMKHIVVELFGENLIRARGHVTRSILKAQCASPAFTPVYACVVAVINSKLPQIGELLLKRLIIQFRKSFRRNDKTQCLAAITFLAHMVNVRVAHEIVALQILTLLLELPTDDSVELAVGFMKECGKALSKLCPKPTNLIFERFRSVLLEQTIEKRVQYMIEVLFQIRKEKFKEYPSIKEDLDLVEEDDQITHYISLDDELDSEETLNFYKYDPEYDANESKYAAIKREIIGTDDEDDEEHADGDDSEASDESEPHSDSESVENNAKKSNALVINDQTNTNVTNLRKTIYLTIMSSVEFEETVHKILKLKIPEGSELEVCKMIAECCSQERSYLKYYGLISERLCKLNVIWMASYEKAFMEFYDTIHRYQTNQIRNIAKLFGHLLETDAILWSLFDVVHLNEEETTASSRIFLKILLQDLNEYFGKAKLIEKFEDPQLQEFFGGIFPTEDPQNLRFSINFFTAIGLGYLTDNMRAILQNIPENRPTLQESSPKRKYVSSSSSSSPSFSDLSSDD